MGSDGDSLFDGMDFVTSVDDETDLKSAESNHASRASTQADEGHDITAASTVTPRPSPSAETESDTSRLNQRKDGQVDAETASIPPSNSDGALGANAPAFGVQGGPLDENLFSDLSVEQEGTANEDTANDRGSGVEEASPDQAHTHATESTSISEVVSAGPDSEENRVGEGAGGPAIPRALSTESSDSRGTAEVDRGRGAATGVGSGGLITKQPAPRKKKRSIRVGYGREEEEEAGTLRPAAEVSAPGGKVDLASLYASNPTAKSSTSEKVEPMDLMTEQEVSTSDVASRANTAVPPSLELSSKLEEKAENDTEMETVQGMEIETENEVDRGVGVERSEGAAAVGDTSDDRESTDREVEDEVQEGGDDKCGREDVEETAEEVGGIPETDIDSLPLMDRVLAVRERIESEVRSLHKLVSALSADRKLAVQNRRAANLKYLENFKKVKDLEAELAEACEKEEFERADEISTAIEEAEVQVERMSIEAREAEEECEVAAGKLGEAEAKEVELSENGAKKLLVVHEVHKG